jgi:pimeloyl-ACP methyl ester carboxylesterase
MAGAVITQTAEYRPERIKALVYLCAFLPRNGESIALLAKQDQDSFSARHRVTDAKGGFSTVKEEAVQEAFYADCSEEDVVRAKSLRVPEPVAPSQTAVKTTKENFGRVPRVYIECLRDRSISPSLQRQMYEALPCERVITLQTSHSPFFSASEELVAHLGSL